MNWKGLYIGVLLVGFGLSNGLSQAADSLQCDSNIYTIVLNCIPMFNDDTLEDGDEINVISNITDVAWQRNTINYLADSINTIPLEGTLAVDSSPDNTNLEFSIYSFSENCLSSKVDYKTDEMNSSDCILFVNSFKAVNHIVELPSEPICTGDEPVALSSDIPDSNFILTADSAGLRINEKGEIVPRESVPGKHIVNVTSNYCLENDRIEIEIIASPDLSLEDTLPICRGNSFSELAPDFSNLQFLGSNDSETYVTGDISRSGYYIAVLNEKPCASVDTVYVELIEPPEILRWDLQEECDRVIVNPILSVSANYKVNWSNNIQDLENVVYSDTSLSVSIVDEFGCEVKDTVKIEVKKLAFRSAQIQKEEADCWTEGNLEINAEKVDNYRGSYRYQLYNNLTNQIITDLDEVPEGVYTLQVVDDHGCSANYEEQKVKVEQKCLEDYPAFSPDGDNIEDDYFIPHEGTVSIYNRDGILIKELETPAYWDGTDAQGRHLPMGNYLLVTETGRTVNITIIR